MLKIGITGGIGSGKSTVCRLFEQLGIPVYSADLRARQLMTDDELLVKEVKKAFGDEMYEGSELQRPRLAAVVFNNPEKLALLNGLVHPAVFRDFRQWATLQNGVPYVMKEAALMFETESYKDVDYVVTVSAPKELRIKRVVERDKTTRAEVLKRMARQLTERERQSRANFVIHNNGEKPLIPQVMDLHKKFLGLVNG